MKILIGFLQGFFDWSQFTPTHYLILTRLYVAWKIKGILQSEWWYYSRGYGLDVAGGLRAVAQVCIWMIPGCYEWYLILEVSDTLRTRWPHIAAAALSADHS